EGPPGSLTMDATIITAIAAVCGSLVGAAASIPYPREGVDALQATRCFSRSYSAYPIQPLRAESFAELHLPVVVKLAELSERGSRNPHFAPNADWGPDPLGLMEGVTLPSKLITSGRLRAGLRLLGLSVLACTFGCGNEHGAYHEGLSQRILPPLDAEVHQEV